MVNRETLCQSCQETFVTTKSIYSNEHTRKVTPFQKELYSPHKDQETIYVFRVNSKNISTNQTYQHQGKE